MFVIKTLKTISAYFVTFLVISFLIVLLCMHKSNHVNLFLSVSISVVQERLLQCCYLIKSLTAMDST